MTIPLPEHFAVIPVWWKLIRKRTNTV